MCHTSVGIKGISKDGRLQMINQIILLIVTVIIFSLSNSPNAQTFIKTTDMWSAFQDGKGKNRVCYIASEPTKETGNYKRRDDTFVLVTQRPAENKLDVFELRAGYQYKKDSTVIIDIDGQKFKLFTFKNTAWAKTSKADHTLARAMIRGRVMTVTGTSSRGTKTFDTYSLKGFTAAYNITRKNCGKS